MLVEDDPDLLELYGEMLRFTFNEVVRCADAVHALRLLGASEFDVVVTDLRLPRMSGLDLAVALRGSSIGIVLLSGAAPDPDDDAGDDVDIRLLKPFTIDQLLDAVEVAFRHSRQHEQNASQGS